jgi:hypothetical protein
MCTPTIHVELIRNVFVIMTTHQLLDDTLEQFHAALPGYHMPMVCSYEPIVKAEGIQTMLLFILIAIFPNEIVEPESKA